MNTRSSTLTIDHTLGDIATHHPELLRELERRGLDYCCGGRRTLDEAARAVGLEPSTVLAELSAVSAPPTLPDWSHLDAPALCEHLVATHHAYLTAELPRLAALVDKIVGVHGERHPELADVAALFHELRADLEPHLRKEEQVLFPMIRELAAAVANGAAPPTFHCGSLANPISVMLVEHETVGELLERLRATTHDYLTPTDGCASYRACFDGLAQLEADTHLHVHKENNRLFPLVAELEASCGGTPS